MRPRNLPSTWRMLTMDQIAADVPNAIVDGPFGSNLKLSDYVEQGVPVLQGKNITDDVFRWFDVRYVSPKKADELKRSAVKVGDILVVKIGSIGYSAIVRDLQGFDFALIPANLAKVTPNASVVDTSYLHKWITSIDVKEYLQGSASKTAQPALSLGKLKKLPVPVPPLTEQRRIADVLDRAEALRTKRRAALAQLDTLTQSIFLDLFGDPATNTKEWPMLRMEELLVSVSYGTSEKAHSVGEFPVLRMNNITRTGGMDLGDLKYMDLETDARERYLVKQGDVLFNRTNSAELVGKSAIVRSERPMAYAGYLIRLRANAENDPEYIAAFLNTRYAKGMLRGMCKSIIGMANISATQIKAMMVGKPPLDLQREFARRIAAVEKLRSTQRASLAQLDALFASLQHRAFRGEL